MQLPPDFCHRMKAMLGEEYPIFERTMQTGEPFTGVRLRSDNAKRSAVLRLLENAPPMPWSANGFYADKSILNGKHPYHAAGLVYFQEPSAMAPVEALDLHPNDYVLDLCAAPGGKATQALDCLGENGLLVANEIDRKRASILAENIERFGCANTLVTNETPERLADRFPAFFDKIIVDAPCSGEGMFRKEPQALDQWTEEYTRVCAERDRAIIDCAVRMLRGGGQLVYSTCTFAPCENEGVIAYILDTYPDMTLLPVPQLSMLSAGSADYIGSSHDLSAARRVFPHRHNGEGHFIALLQKADEPQPRPSAAVKAVKIDLTPYRAFEQDTLTTTLDGQFVLFGDALYRLPNGISNVTSLRTVRAGLHLGTYKKGRFEPSHAFALTLTAEKVQRHLNLLLGSDELAHYLHGETLPCQGSGWTLVTVDGFALGWGKASNGILKNHFPKHLRV